MDNLLLSIVTFAPALAAVILLILARGEDEAAGGEGRCDVKTHHAASGGQL